MRPFRKIKEEINMFGTKSINIYVVDVGLNAHVAQFTYETGELINFHTRKVIDNPVLWCHLPDFNEKMFDEESELI